jgi:hypothetical protein
MIDTTILAIGGIALIAGAALGWWLPPHGRRPRRREEPPVRSILLPFTGEAISKRALQAAVRLARAEEAVIMPAFLARVPRHLPLEAPLPIEASRGMPLLEAIEQSAAVQGVEVNPRVSRGRTYRHALERLLAGEPVDRVIISADRDPHRGIPERDLMWLIEAVPAEVMILRPASDDPRQISGAHVRGHF